MTKVGRTNWLSVLWCACVGSSSAGWSRQTRWRSLNTVRSPRTHCTSSFTWLQVTSSPRTKNTNTFRWWLGTTHSKGFNNDGHKPWRPQTMTIMAATMTATTNNDDQSEICPTMLWIWQFLKSTVCIFYTFSLLWLSWYTLWPSWFVAVMV